MGNKTCATCKWFDPDSSNLGRCRVMPPVVIPSYTFVSKGETKPFTTWPIVRDHDWCGDHQNKE